MFIVIFYAQESVSFQKNGERVGYSIRVQQYRGITFIIAIANLLDKWLYKAV